MSSDGLPTRRSATSKAPPTLIVQDFAQIALARIAFGDLTVLVGPQATGKSLLLQWLKFAVDPGETLHALKEAGHNVKDPNGLVDLLFGEGMGPAWRETSSVTLNGNAVSPQLLTKRMPKWREPRVFFIPAHRALLLAEGWPAPFLKLGADVPVVARLFSQNLYQRFSGRKAEPLFPVERVLKGDYRDRIDEAVFHGGRMDLHHEGLAYRLRLSFKGKIDLPYWTWTAGQREFAPLLLGLYHVLIPRKQAKHPHVDWVVIEEPEMGLHPQAIAVIMLLVLDLLWRGYRVVMSTHSPLVLDIVWAIRQLKESNARPQLLSEAFGLEKYRSVVEVMENALRSDYRVHFMSMTPGSRLVNSRDISGLDPDSGDSAESEWGGLTGFSASFGRAVRKAANETSQASQTPELSGFDVPE